jgi:hypothetical protein
MARGPLDRLKPHLAEPDPESGGPWVGRDPRGVTLAAWEAAGVARRTPMEAIRAKCLGCCGGVPKEVRLCMALNCPIWPYRMGTDPFRGSRQAPAEIGCGRPISDPNGDVSGPGSDTVESG